MPAAVWWCRDSVLRRLAHVPLGWRATIPHVRIRRYRCSGCGQVWRQDTTAAAAPRAKLSTQAVTWALKSVVTDRMSIAHPLHGIRRVPRTGVGLLTDRQHALLTSVFTADEHAAVEATWGTYQRIVSAYRHPDRRAGKTELAVVIKTISHGVPAGLPELSRLGRTLNQRAADVLAYFDRPGTSNGPTEAINGRPEHLRGTALGFRNLTNYITRSLLDMAASDPDHTLFRDEPLLLGVLSSALSLN
jgi:transposase